MIPIFGEKIKLPKKKKLRDRDLFETKKKDYIFAKKKRKK